MQKLTVKAHPQSHGLHPTDCKAFVLNDKDFAFDRAHRPDILFKFEVSYSLAADIPPTGIMMYQGHVVIDQDDHEIRLFPDIPDVLSSTIEGWEIEYYKRKYRKLQHGDLVGKSDQTSMT